MRRPAPPLLLALALLTGCSQPPASTLSDAGPSSEDGSSADATPGADASSDGGPSCGNGRPDPDEPCEPDSRTLGCSDDCQFAATCEDPVVISGDVIEEGESLMVAAAREVGSCGGAGGEHVFRWVTPRAGRLRAQLVSGTPLVLHVRRGTCTDAAAEVVCADADRLAWEDDLMTVEAGETLYFIVDREETTPVEDGGAVFFLDARVIEVVPTGGACDPFMTEGEPFCAPGQHCDGRLAEPICQPGQAPRITQARAFRPPAPFTGPTVRYDHVRVRLEAIDPDRDVLGFQMILRDEAGEELYRHEGRYFYEHDEDGDRSTLGIDFIDPYLDRAMRYASVDVRIYDTGFASSDWAHADIVVPPPVALGGRCDMARWEAPCGEGLVCDRETLVCVNGVVPVIERALLWGSEADGTSMPLRIYDPDGPFVESGFGAGKRPYVIRFEYLAADGTPTMFDGDGDGDLESTLSFNFLHHRRDARWVIDPGHVAGSGFRPDIAVERAVMRDLPLAIVVRDDSGLEARVVIDQHAPTACSTGTECDLPFERCDAEGQRWDWVSRRCEADRPGAIIRAVYHQRATDAVIGIEVDDPDRDGGTARVVLLDERGSPISASLDGFFEPAYEAYMYFEHGPTGPGRGELAVVASAMAVVRSVVLYLPDDPDHPVRADLVPLPVSPLGGGCDVGDSQVFATCVTGAMCVDGTCTTREEGIARLCAHAPVLTVGGSVTVTLTRPSLFEPPAGCGDLPLLMITPEPRAADAMIVLRVTEPVARLRLTATSTDRSAAPILSVHRGCGDSAPLWVCRGNIESDWGSILDLRDVPAGDLSIRIDDTYAIPSDITLTATSVTTAPPPP